MQGTQGTVPASVAAALVGLHDGVRGQWNGTSDQGVTYNMAAYVGLELSAVL